MLQSLFVPAYLVVFFFYDDVIRCDVRNNTLRLKTAEMGDPGGEVRVRGGINVILVVGLGCINCGV